MTSALQLLIFFIIVWQEEVPYKPASEFELKIDYKFQERAGVDRYKADYDVGADNKKNRSGSGPLPYLKLELKLLQLGSDEVKVRIVNSDGHLILNRKVTPGMLIKLDVGFIDDVKDRISPHEFTASLYSDSKKATSQIKLLIMEDGTFLVNEEKKGKF